MHELAIACGSQLPHDIHIYMEIPSTPLTILERDPSAPQGPFLVKFKKLAHQPEKRDGFSEEVLRLADLILDCFLECNEQ